MFALMAEHFRCQPAQMNQKGIQARSADRIIRGGELGDYFFQPGPGDFHFDIGRQRVLPQNVRVSARSFGLFFFPLNDTVFSGETNQAGRFIPMEENIEKHREKQVPAVIEDLLAIGPQEGFSIILGIGQ